MSEAVTVDAALLQRLQSRVRDEPRRGGPPRALATAASSRPPGRTLPRVSALRVDERRSEASRYSGVRYFLEATAAGQTVADMLPRAAHQGPLKLEPSFDEHATPAAWQTVEQMFQQRLEEQRRSRQLVQQLNERPDEVTDEEVQRPTSPGQEYDLQYMQYALQGPRFSASVHEKVLAMQGLTSQDQQKFLSSAKDVEASLRKEHARYNDDWAGGGGEPRTKRRRVPRPPRGKKNNALPLSSRPP